MEYQIVWAISSRELERKVRTEIAEGWKPQGGLAALGSYNWQQAMIRLPEDRPLEPNT